MVKAEHGTAAKAPERPQETGGAKVKGYMAVGMRHGSEGSGTAHPLALARMVVLAVLLLLAGYLALRLVLALLSPESRHRPVQLAAPVQAQASGPVAYDFSYNPFTAGDAAEDAPVEAAPATDDAPETTLNLVLTGQRAGPNGSAFIRTPDGNADNYYVGDEVMSGVYLRDVRSDHIVIDVNGQAQRLTSEDAKANARDARTAPPSGSARLSTLKSVTAQDFITKFDLQPALDGDLQRLGVKLVPRSPATKLSDYGLKSGDIFTSVAGVDLTRGFPDPVALSRAVQPGRPAVVQLIRDGRPMSITIG